MSATEDKAIWLFREQLRAAHQLLEGTVGDVMPEQAHWSPPGTVNPLGANYAHVLVSEDATMNGLLKGGLPLFVSTWAGKVGLSEQPPMPNPNAPGFPDWSEWGQRVKVDLAALRKYAQAVYAASDGYLASLTDDGLNRPANLSALGLGESTVGYVLTHGVLGNAFSHSGEISCLKGLRGKRGYPF